ncbi:S8/S53 family peptidase [Pseudomonas sp. 2835]|uniref:S8/S53 family peptidase n=1 Tax=Pseudomonas sp. 2835 TaxID=3156451 RepID=UPI003D19AA6B
MKGFVLLLAWMGLVSPLALAAEAPLRITQLQRCGDLLTGTNQQWCLQVSGLGEQRPTVWLGDKALPVQAVQRQGQVITLHLQASQHRSAPLWLEAPGQRSNPVWLSLNSSHVLAARPDEVAKNMDGLTTYVDLVSLLIEEQHDGLAEARRIADKYGARVVGAIPPLNTYQLRLPAGDLMQRDALLLRMGSEASVDAVIVEESAPERGEEGSADSAQPVLERDEWAANRFMDAVYYYRKRIPAAQAPIKVQPVRVGVIERNVDFDAPDFAGYSGGCTAGVGRLCVFARDAGKPDNHGSSVAGILAADWQAGGNSGFLFGLDKASPGFEVIVERNSDAGITANIAASVNLVEDGVRVLNWSWGIHRVGAKDIQGDEVDSLVRSGLAMSGYEELLEEFFLWLRAKHPDVIVINSAGNGSSRSGTDEYRLPSSFITDQLLVVGGHQRAEQGARLEEPGYVVKRDSSNVDMRVDISAAACIRASTAQVGQPGAVHCGTSYATPLVTATVAAMLSINPALTPEQLRMLLRRSAMTLGQQQDFEAMDGEDLTAPILPSERNGQLYHPDLGRSARLDMQKALELAVQSRDRVR